MKTENGNTGTPYYPTPSVSYTDDPDDLTLGVFKGELADKRPFVADIWWWDNFVGVT